MFYKQINEPGNNIIIVISIIALNAVGVVFWHGFADLSLIVVIRFVFRLQSAFK